MESTQQKHKLINPLTRYEDFKFELPPNTYPKQVLQTSFKYPPDCGEKSYVASGRLKGRHALVTGGDSGIGRAVVSKQPEDFFSRPVILASAAFVSVSLLVRQSMGRCRSIPLYFLNTNLALLYLTANRRYYSRHCPGGCQGCHQLSARRGEGCRSLGRFPGEGPLCRPQADPDPWGSEKPEILSRARPYSPQEIGVPGSDRQ